ncbi:outer membrane protein assembly factor BamB family protein [Allorhodopirellula heiligendammensis]|uniref:Outer membrane biogenesis protein BamB n=1 Tax=Allorhodopirellula heiligendammensis TaxID=2714739 RepID=A0A5C6C0G1_9BACT|nr:PQQ-binding-like beta-propeller repeat protein [Allorhodopirellula heiligendammensis]TWU16634.1 outer membrane biogenesis protein BamB [Allorhodopirellula heiligendammensis]
MCFTKIARWCVLCTAWGCTFADSAATSRAAEPAAIASNTDPVRTTNEWTSWRGPQADGSGDAEQMPPTQWSESEHIAWQTPIPGRGHASPVVRGDEVFLPTADLDRQIQSVLCFDAKTGRQKWESIVHEGGFNNKNAETANSKASFASSTIAADNEQLYVNFFNDDAIYTTALDHSGHILWQQKISDYTMHQGYGSSPALHGPLVIVSADNKGGGAVAGLDRKSGKIVWSHDRPSKPNYASPIVHHLNGRDQLILTGCDLVTSLNPLTGEVLWEIPGATTECVTTTVTDGTHVYSSGGYPKNHVAAIVADGSGRVAWEINKRIYVPSMVIRDGYLYVTFDDGIAGCIDAATGEEIWKKRLGGTFSSSPVLVGTLIYATNEDGETFIFEATPEKFQSAGKNKIGQSVFATPAIVGGKIYTRVAKMEDDQRQEYLVCISN